MKRLTAWMVILCLAIAVPAMAEQPIFYRTLGTGTYTPNTLTDLGDTPDDSATGGVAMPSATTAIEITVKNYAIHYFTGKGTPSATAGQKLDPGTYFIHDPYWIQSFQFIDTSAGASTVVVSFKKVAN